MNELLPHLFRFGGTFIILALSYISLHIAFSGFKTLKLKREDLTHPTSKLTGFLTFLLGTITSVFLIGGAVWFFIITA